MPTISTTVEDSCSPSFGCYNQTISAHEVLWESSIQIRRNIFGHNFPHSLSNEEARELASNLAEIAINIPDFKEGTLYFIKELSLYQKTLLIEKRLLTTQLAENDVSGCILISKNQRLSLMINEDDHLVLTVHSPCVDIEKPYRVATRILNKFAKVFDFAFLPTIGYLTANPCFRGTGLIASYLIHIPALVYFNQLDTIRTGLNNSRLILHSFLPTRDEPDYQNVFELFSPTTLGASPTDFLAHLSSTATLLEKMEHQARQRIQDTPKEKKDFITKLQTAYNILLKSHVLKTSEALNLISILILGIDLGLIKLSNKTQINRLLSCPLYGCMHLYYHQSINREDADSIRAHVLRQELEKLPPPTWMS